jgi:hypothetical protein
MTVDDSEQSAAAGASAGATSTRPSRLRSTNSGELAGMRGVVNAFNQSDLETRIAQEMDTKIAMQDAAAAAKRRAREIKHQAQVCTYIACLGM